MTRRNAKILALLAPLVLFLLFSFAGPVTVMLARAVLDTEVRTAWPQTAGALRIHEAPLPDAEITRVFTEELEVSLANGLLPAAANRLNRDRPGMRSLVFSAARALPVPPGKDPLSYLASVDPRWNDAGTWAVIRHASGPVSTFHLLAALDRRLDQDDQVISVPAEQRIFLPVLWRTMYISLVVAAICVVLGYPLAHLMATARPAIRRLMLLLVLLPLWTSVLVRTTAWMVLLQENGIVNAFIQAAGLASDPLNLIYNRTGVYIAMVHVLLPYMVLPLYGVMSGIHPVTLQASQSLGATPLSSFLRVYLPLSMPGVASGFLIVFVLSLGFYVTPALVGGADDQLVSSFIALYTTQSLNWGLAAALSLLLLLATAGCLWVLAKLNSRFPVVSG